METSEKEEIPGCQAYNPFFIARCGPSQLLREGSKVLVKSKGIQKLKSNNGSSFREEVTATGRSPEASKGLNSPMIRSKGKQRYFLLDLERNFPLASKPRTNPISYPLVLARTYFPF